MAEATDANEDELLALRCQLGEPGAFDDLLAKWAGPLHRYVLRVAGDAAAAEDLMQEVWLSVVKGFGRLKEASQLRSWLFSIAHARLMDHYRARYRTAQEHAFDFDTLAIEEAAQDLIEEIEAGLAHLPAPDREILTLFYLQELPLTEVAAVLSVPVGTVKSRLFKARSLLRKHLQEPLHGTS